MRRLRTFLFLAVTAVFVSAGLKPAVSEADGFLLCSCELCAHSNVVCRISPTGFSIACSDYYQNNCQP
jgi:hypothetical protein